MSARPPGHAGRPRTGPSGRRAHGALVLTAVLAVVGGCTAAPGTSPGGAPSESPVSSPPETSTPEPSAGATTSPTSSAPADDDQAPALHVGGAIGDHPVDAPEAEVVPYLTDVFGTEPQVDGGGVACETNGLPGRRLVWDGLTVLVRTTDETDATTEPYVAGWALDERNGTSSVGPLSTAEGIGLGDPEQAVTAAYPLGQRFDVPEMGMSLWVVGSVDGDHTDDLAVRLVDGVVTMITGGFGCGE